MRRAVIPLIVLALLAAGGLLWSGGPAAQPADARSPGEGADRSDPSASEIDGAAPDAARRPRHRVDPARDSAVAAEPHSHTDTIVLTQALRLQEARATLRPLDSLAPSEKSLFDAGAISQLDYDAFRIEHLLARLWLAPAEDRASLREQLREIGERIGRQQDARRDAGRTTPTRALETRIATQGIAEAASWSDSPLAGRDSPRAAERRESLESLLAVWTKAISRRSADVQWTEGLRRDAAGKRLPLLDRLLAHPKRLSLGDRTALRIERVLLRARLGEIEGTDARRQAVEVSAAARAALEPHERAAIDGLVALIRWETSQLRRDMLRR